MDTLGARHWVYGSSWNRDISPHRSGSLAEDWLKSGNRDAQGYLGFWEYHSFFLFLLSQTHQGTSKCTQAVLLSGCLSLGPLLCPAPSLMAGSSPTPSHAPFPHSHCPPTVMLQSWWWVQHPPLLPHSGRWEGVSYPSPQPRFPWPTWDHGLSSCPQRKLTFIINHRTHCPQMTAVCLKFHSLQPPLSSCLVFSGLQKLPFLFPIARIVFLWFQNIYISLAQKLENKKEDKEN